MSKEHESSRENRKKPVMSLKEKRAAKKAKKADRPAYMTFEKK